MTRFRQRHDLNVAKLLSDPKAIGVVAVAGSILVVLFSFAGSFLWNADVQRYRQLKKLQADIQELRGQNAIDYSDVKSRAQKLLTEYVPVLKKQAGKAYPAKQNLLWACMELQKMVDGDLTQASTEDKNFAELLNEAAKALNIH